jgi:hypothetical protein
VVAAVLAPHPSLAQYVGTGQLDRPLLFSVACSACPSHSCAETYRHLCLCGFLGAARAVQIPGYAAARFNGACRVYLAIALFLLVMIGRVIPMVAYAAQLLSLNGGSALALVAVVIVAATASVLGGFSALLRAQVCACMHHVVL